MFGKITFGSFGTVLVKVLIALGNFGFSCVYFKVFGNIIDIIITAITGEENSSKFYYQAWFYITIAFVILLPFVIVDNQSLLNVRIYFNILIESFDFRSYRIINVCFSCYRYFFHKVITRRSPFYQGNALATAE